MVSITAEVNNAELEKIPWLDGLVQVACGCTCATRAQSAKAKKAHSKPMAPEITRSSALFLPVEDISMFLIRKMFKM